MQFLPKHLTEGYRLPEIGKCTCVFGQEGAFYYLHIVIAPMLLSNLFLFGFSSWGLCCGVWAPDRKGVINKVRKVISGSFMTDAKLYIGENKLLIKSSVHKKMCYFYISAPDT